jgi:hypothetical protein
VRLHTRPRPIRLGASQLAVVLSGLLVMAVVAWALGPFDWDDLYHRDVLIPGMQASHGFTWGAVSFDCRSLAPQTYQGVTSVVPGGRFSRLGIRGGDVPAGRHGRGYRALFSAVQAAELETFTDLEVLNAQDCHDGKQAFRTLALYPAIREVPVSLAHGLLPSPTGTHAVEVLPARGDEAYHVSLVDLIAGGSRPLWSFRLAAKATWSSDGRWLAVTDTSSTRWRCILFDVTRHVAIAPLEQLKRLPAAARPDAADASIDCEIFGWVHGEPTHVALTARTLAPAPGARWRFDYFFDVENERLAAAASR